MAVIPLTGSSGFFVALGHLFGGLEDILALRGGAASARTAAGASMVTRRATVFADYAAQSPKHEYLLSQFDAQVSQWANAQNTFNKAIALQGQNLLVEMANDSVKLPAKTLQNALLLLVNQMANSADAIQQVTASSGSQAAFTGTTPIGNGKIYGSVLNRYGKTLQYCFPETVTFRCTKDSYSGGATSGQETFSASGQTLLTDVYAYNWPYGSGSTKSMTACDPRSSNSGGNKLYNSGYETFSTTDYPDNWVIVTGPASTNVFQDVTAADVYTGSSSLKLTGAGGTTISITQQFNKAASTTAGAGGTPATLLPDTPYLFSIWVRAISAAPLAGVLTVDLIDQAGNVITDDAGSSNSFTIDLTATTTTYANYSGVFRLPASMVNTAGLSASQYVRLRIRTSTLITNGSSVNIDHACFSEMTQLYTGGPYFGVHSASKPFTTGDAWTIAIANNGGGTAPQWPLWLERIFGMHTFDSVASIPTGMQIPFSTGGGITVSSSLIA